MTLLFAVGAIVYVWLGVWLTLQDPATALLEALEQRRVFLWAAGLVALFVLIVLWPLFLFAHKR